MRIGLDATPLLGRRTGIGVYVQRLIETLAQRPADVDLVATAFTLRGAGELAAHVPPGIRTRTRPVPARLLQQSWQRTAFPPVEWLCGPIDVFHGTNYVLPPARRAGGVVNVHDLSFLRFPQTVSMASLRYRELVPRSIRRAAVILALTESMAADICDEYKIAPDRIVVTPPGVDREWFDATPLTAEERATLGLPRDYIVAVGTLEPRKNLPLLIEAYNRLRREDETTPALVLVGPPGWGPALALDTLPAGSVFTTGYLEDKSLRGVVAGARCLAYPSVYEGFGLPPVEALACGVPVVASDLPVTREVLGSAARLVAVGDVDALADALRAAVTGQSTAAEVETRRAQARRWTWKRCADATIGAYLRADAVTGGAVNS
ncbi:MAG: glycosyltransferase family 1 protein [Pseudonocardiales bacterium]|nr:glycosyltransferase family 1 protein [Pseudonocardiales bacterium]